MITTREPESLSSNFPADGLGLLISKSLLLVPSLSKEDKTGECRSMVLSMNEALNSISSLLKANAKNKAKQNTSFSWAI
jgi:hypothetical protein